MFATAYMGQKRWADPDFLLRGAINTRVCGFH
jgi:hypothetical protein